jgi:hypothetical protein
MEKPQVIEALEGVDISDECELQWCSAAVEAVGGRRLRWRRGWLNGGGEDGGGREQVGRVGSGISDSDRGHKAQRQTLTRSLSLLSTLQSVAVAVNARTTCTSALGNALTPLSLSNSQSQSQVRAKKASTTLKPSTINDSLTRLTGLITGHRHEGRSPPPYSTPLSCIDDVHHRSREAVIH